MYKHGRLARSLRALGFFSILGVLWLCRGPIFDVVMIGSHWLQDHVFFFLPDPPEL